MTNLKILSDNPKSVVDEGAVGKTPKNQTPAVGASLGHSEASLSRTQKALTNIDLIICARANANRGLEAAASLCGYGQDFKSFQDALKQACQHIGIKLDYLHDLIKDSTRDVNMQSL